MKDAKGPRFFAEHIDRHTISDRDARNEHGVCGHDAVEPLSLGQRLYECLHIFLFSMNATLRECLSCNPTTLSGSIISDSNNERRAADSSWGLYFMSPAALKLNTARTVVLDGVVPGKVNSM